MSPALAAGSLPLASPGKPITTSTLPPYQWVVFLQWNILMLGCDRKVLVGGALQGGGGGGVGGKIFPVATQEVTECW